MLDLLTILSDQKEELQNTDVSLLITRREESLFNLKSKRAQVVIGVRRCGKSTICKKVLIESKINFAYVNFDDERLMHFKIDDMNSERVVINSVPEKIYNELLEKSGYKDNKWKNEYNLYLLVKTYFNDAIFQYKFEELGEQRIDIFIPSLNIAIEYQGEQHYFSGIFGDESDFKHGQLLDERKRKICKDNNIHLIEWHYENKINKIELDYAMYEYKELLNGKYEFSNIIKR